MNAATHFATRAAERAQADDTDALYHDLRIALADPERWADYIEPVKRLKDGATAYRFRIATGFFYVIAKCGRPVTIYTQEQMRNKKYAIKSSRAKVSPDVTLWRKSRT